MLFIDAKRTWREGHVPGAGVVVKLLRIIAIGTLHPLNISLFASVNSLDSRQTPREDSDLRSDASQGSLTRLKENEHLCSTVCEANVISSNGVCKGTSNIIPALTIPTRITISSLTMPSQPTLQKPLSQLPLCFIVLG